MLVKGSKIKLVKPMGAFTNVGEICEVTDITDGVITFKFGGGMHMGCMSTDEMKKYFEEVVEKKPLYVTNKQIEKAMNNSKIIIHEVFGKCTIVACQLPSGFVIVESSSCVDEKSYDKDTGIECCINRIKDRVCELEAYKLQAENPINTHKSDNAAISFEEFLNSLDTCTCAEDCCCSENCENHSECEDCNNDSDGCYDCNSDCYTCPVRR